MTSYERQQARIAARKARNEQYYNRLVKNPKARALGVDKAFLDKQVEYKKAVAAAEKQADLEYAEQTAAIVDILEERKYKMDEEKAEENASYKAAWDVQVAEKPNRREYELNDPKILSKTRPPRVGDDDPNCGE